MRRSARTAPCSSRSDLQVSLDPVRPITIVDCTAVLLDVDTYLAAGREKLEAPPRRLSGRDDPRGARPRGVPSRVRLRLRGVRHRRRRARGRRPARRGARDDPTSDRALKQAILAHEEEYREAANGDGLGADTCGILLSWARDEEIDPERAKRIVERAEA